MDGCNHSVKKITLYDTMDKTDPPGEASKFQKMNDWSLLISLNKITNQFKE